VDSITRVGDVVHHLPPTPHAKRPKVNVNELLATVRIRYAQRAKLERFGVWKDADPDAAPDAQENIATTLESFERRAEKRRKASKRRNSLAATSSRPRGNDNRDAEPDVEPEADRGAHPIVTHDAVPNKQQSVEIPASFLESPDLMRAASVCKDARESAAADSPQISADANAGRRKEVEEMLAKLREKNAARDVMLAKAAEERSRRRRTQAPARPATQLSRGQAAARAFESADAPRTWLPTSTRQPPGRM